MDPMVLFQIKVLAYSVLAFDVIGWSVLYLRQTRTQAGRVKVPEQAVANHSLPCVSPARI